MALSLSSPVLKFATVAGGVFIEDVQDGRTERDGSERCFRFDAEGRSEYATLKDLLENGDRARWYSHQFRARDFIFA